ncbi:uncharacterized protein [Branchiostoma lanceolatum]|uniref:uncharacterized protein n=1 Tax=Branchiostoma lanceolatum TaxID=7740 RepID=UPI003453AE7E
MATNAQPENVSRPTNMSEPTPHFLHTGICERLKERLGRESSFTILLGICGSGKTQLALWFAAEFKLRHRDAILWRLDANSADSMAKTKAGLLRCLSGRAGKEGDEDIAIEKAMKESKVPVFVLIDDLDDAERLPPFSLKSQPHCHIVITTHNRKLLKGSIVGQEVILVNGFNREEAFSFFNQESQGFDREEVLALVDKFDGLPLGLAASRGYMARCRISPRAYLQLLDEKAAVSRIEEEESRWLGKYYEKPGTKDGAIKLLNLFAAIRMAVDKLSPNVVSMLKLAAFMDNTNIPLLVLTEDPTNVTPRMRQENADALESEVEGLSLATVEGAGENRILSLHRVTQTSMQLAMTEEEEKELVQRLLNTLLTFFVKDNRYSCSGQLSYSLMPHVETVLTHACRISRDDHHLSRARLYEVLGFLYTQRGMAAKAEGPLRLAKKLLEDLAEVTLKESSETPQGQATGETGGDEVEQDARLLFEKLALTGQRLPDNVFSQILQNKVLVDQDVEMFRSKLPTEAELDQIYRDKQPLSPAQLDLLVRHGLVLPLDRLKEIYLPELHVSINYSLGRCYFYTKEKYRTDPEGKRDLVKCMELAYSLAKEIQRRTGVAVIHQYLTERNALLYLRLEEEGKDAKQLNEDILYARERYSVLLKDQEDYFEFGMLKKSGRELYSMTICHRQLVRCYNQLIKLADTDDEKAGYFEQAQQHCREMIQYAEGEIQRDEQGKVTDQLERLANFYNTAGRFLAADQNPTHLDEALEWYRKAYQLEKGQGRVDYPLSDALFGLTEGLIRRGDFSKAQVFATELLAVYKANWPEKTRDIEKAKALLEKVTDLI